MSAGSLRAVLARAAATEAYQDCRSGPVVGLDTCTSFSCGVKGLTRDSSGPVSPATPGAGDYLGAHDRTGGGVVRGPAGAGGGGRVPAAAGAGPGGGVGRGVWVLGLACDVRCTS